MAMVILNAVITVSSFFYCELSIQCFFLHNATIIGTLVVFNQLSEMVTFDILFTGILYFCLSHTR